ncbi:MAG: TIGR03564 family F420-dependent LLM class oxidoreductase [Acidimicrobiia bacterium]|nr:TIGR03564 family F420-dependent LLM class oxidoreductase [Acidimicrobiia bacterium]
MRIGAMIGGETAGEVVGKARDLEERGFDSVWIGAFLGYGLEALTAMTLIARETERIELGTAVVPIYFHHPLALAEQAVSIQQVAGGRFTLGIGLSHPFIVEDWLGMPYTKGAAKMSDYLSITRRLLNGATADFTGDYYSAHAGIHLADARRVPLLSAALGPRMLKLAGELTDGTVTYMAGLQTLEKHIIPRIRSAAEAAGNPPPRIVAGGIPMALVNDVDAARTAVQEQHGGYGDVSTYSRMLDLEGAAKVADIAVVGDERVLRDFLDRLEAIGVTDLMASLAAVDDGAVERTTDFLTAQL